MVDITITSIDTITAFDIETGNYRFTLDELQNVTVSQAQEKTDITGKQGRKLSSLKRNKSVTVSGTNGLMSCGLLEMQTGTDFANGPTEVLWVDYLTVDAQHEATTKYKAVGTEGAEIDALYLKNADSTLGQKLTQDSTASAGVYTYTPSTKTLEFDSSVASGTEIVVYYKRKIVADVLKDYSDVYSQKCMLYIDATGEDKCAKIYHLQIFVPKADFSGEFSLEFGDNQSVHAFEAEALSGACGTRGEFFTYTVFGENDDDYLPLASIAITTAPKTEYTTGQTFNPAGMVITATYGDGEKTAVVTGYTYAPTGALTNANTTVTISYTEHGVTKTATQAITVS